MPQGDELSIYLALWGGALSCAIGTVSVIELRRRWPFRVLLALTTVLVIAALLWRPIAHQWPDYASMAVEIASRPATINILGVVLLVALAALGQKFRRRPLFLPWRRSREISGQLFANLQRAERRASQMCGNTTNYTGKIAGADRVEFRGLFKVLRQECERLRLDATLDYVNRCDDDVQDDTEWVKAYFRFRTLIEMLEDECQRAGVRIPLGPERLRLALRLALPLNRLANRFFIIGLVVLVIGLALLYLQRP